MTDDNGVHVVDVLFDGGRIIQNTSVVDDRGIADVGTGLGTNGTDNEKAILQMHAKVQNMTYDELAERLDITRWTIARKITICNNKILFFAFIRGIMRLKG